MALAVKHRDESNWEEHWRDHVSRDGVAWDHDCEIVPGRSLDSSDWEPIVERGVHIVVGRVSCAQADASRKINELYSEIGQLISRNASVSSKHLESQISAKLSQLRELQAEEAERMREVFESRLEMPIDAGEKAISYADSILEKYGDSSSSD